MAWVPLVLQVVLPPLIPFKLRHQTAILPHPFPPQESSLQKVGTNTFPDYQCIPDAGPKGPHAFAWAQCKSSLSSPPLHRPLLTPLHPNLTSPSSLTQPRRRHRIHRPNHLRPWLGLHIFKRISLSMSPERHLYPACEYHSESGGSWGGL